MKRRFFAETKVSPHVPFKLTGPDAHHVANVMRLQIGDQVTLFDGSGCEFTCNIEELNKKQVILRVEESKQVSREFPFELTVCVALPKGDRQKVLVEKLVELGVSRFVPLNCERSVVVSSPKSTAKISRWVIEASKQCGRNVLMQIDEPKEFGSLISMFDDLPRIIAHPYGSQNSAFQTTNALNSDTSVAIAIGPEGGFTEKEIKNATAVGWKPTKISETILRVETAAVAMATLFGLGRGH